MTRFFRIDLHYIQILHLLIRSLKLLSRKAKNLFAIDAISEAELKQMVFKTNAHLLLQDQSENANF